MNIVLLVISLLFFTPYAWATDWCGKTIPGGSATNIAVTYLDSHQFCNNVGIKMPSYARLVGNGYTIVGNPLSGKACLRAIGAKYVRVENVEISQCGADGVDFSSVNRSDLRGIKSHHNRNNGIRCNGCIRGFFKENATHSNGSSGIVLQDSSNINGTDNHALWNNLDGIRMINSYDIHLYDGWEQYNGYKDVEFMNNTFGAIVGRGYNGHCYFSNGAFNNICSHYDTCKTDGSGHGSNQCR